MNNARSKEKTTQRPPKEGSSKTIHQEDPKVAPTPANIPEVEESRAPQDPIDPIPQPGVSSPLKEHISLGSEIGVESSEEGDTEASSPSGTPD